MLAAVLAEADRDAGCPSAARRKGLKNRTMNTATLKICRAAHAVGKLALAKRVLASELVAEAWWNVSFFVMIFAAIAVPQVTWGFLLFAASVINLLAATRHRKAVERQTTRK